MRAIVTIAAILTLALTTGPLGWAAAPCCPPPQDAVAQAQGSPAPASKVPQVELPGPGKKVPLPGGGWFTWEFDQKPKMGTVVFKLKAFDKSGARIQTIQARGEVDMPSMRGHHSSGPVEFKVNKGGDYLLPVNIVMRGEWEVAILLSAGDQVLYSGYTRFRV